MYHLVHQVKSFLHTSLQRRFECLGGQDSRPSSLLRRRAGAVHGSVGEGNYIFFFNPKQEKRSLIVQRKIRMVDVEEIFQ